MRPTPGMAMTGADREPAAFKINLMLKVVGKRPDGHHLLETLFAFASDGDVLDWRPGGTLDLTVEGPFASVAPANATNLVLRAAHLLAGQYPQQAKTGGHLTLVKHVPAGAGLGGGSADAAAALRLLNRVWGIGCDLAGLAGLAAQLGADVPVCVYGKPAWARGVGDDLSFLPSGQTLPLMVIFPDVPLSTADVFRSRNAPFSSPEAVWPPENPALSDMPGWRNDLAEPAKRLSPAVADVLARLARMASGNGSVSGFGMSGSGSCCYAVCQSHAAVQHLALQLRSMYPLAWIYEGSLETPFIQPIEPFV
jgi:4-diphosphocytidyl-2-C-methyl-D-erythritol kinase